MTNKNSILGFISLFLITVGKIFASKSSSSSSSEGVNFFFSAAFMNTISRVQQEWERLKATNKPSDVIAGFSSPMKYLHDDFWEKETKRREEQKQMNLLEASSSEVNDSEMICDCVKTCDIDLVNIGTQSDTGIVTEPLEPSLTNKLDLFKNFLEDSEKVKEKSSMKNNKDMTLHFCFLVHGYMGKSSDLTYLESTMNGYWKSHNKSSSGADHIIIHNIQRNEGKTNDGIEKGGERVVSEIEDVLRSHIDKYCKVCKNITNITISFVGNSLGGLYSRYAIARLYTMLLDEKNNQMKLANGIQVHFNVFCSTASPHLGVADNTFFMIPRSAELAFGHAMGTTGKDLFLINDIIWNMSTTEEYLKPLSLFRKRIAYANAFKTDFMVPTETAVFLHSNSRHPHSLIVDNGAENCNKEEENHINELIIASFHTKKEEQFSKDKVLNGFSSVFRNREKNEKDLEFMSTSLDSLGWKKVFVDVRKKIPMGLDLSGIQSRLGTRLRKQPVQAQNVLDILRKKDVIESRDLASAFVSPQDSKYNIPIGHNLICAHSRNRFNALLNRGGRPVMDKLAKEMVEDIKLWKKDVEEKSL